MSWFKKIRERREADREATENSRALLQDIIISEPELEERHSAAIQALSKATEQANRLRAQDIQNHYSESLTHAFRGKTA